MKVRSTLVLDAQQFIGGQHPYPDGVELVWSRIDRPESIYGPLEPLALHGRGIRQIWALRLLPDKYEWKPINDGDWVVTYPGDERQRYPAEAFAMFFEPVSPAAPDGSRE